MFSSLISISVFKPEKKLKNLFATQWAMLCTISFLKKTKQERLTDWSSGGGHKNVILMHKNVTFMHFSEIDYSNLARLIVWRNYNLDIDCSLFIKTVAILLLNIKYFQRFTDLPADSGSIWNQLLRCRRLIFSLHFWVR